jgi:ketosteroid isomerase-like protein
MNANHAWISIATLIFLTLNFGCAQQQPAAPPDNRAADEAALRKADADWSNSAKANQVDAFVAYYTDDATVLPPNSPMAASKDDIRKVIGGFLALPAINLKWQPTKVEVSKSGDVGYTMGTYEMSFNDPEGKPTSDHGKYLEVWKKQGDGSWKCAVDSFSSDLATAN